jgi:hypothetical protein
MTGLFPAAASDTLARWLDENERAVPDAYGAVQSTPRFVTVDVAMTVETTGERCSYVRQRGTEQECVRDLWSVVKTKMTQDLCPTGESFVYCTLHLPLLMADRFVEEYSIVRVHP